LPPRNEFKARAIVGREQATIAMERARYSAAQQRIENRLLDNPPCDKPEPLQQPGSDPLEVLQPKAKPVESGTAKPTEAEALKAETLTRTSRPPSPTHRG
jgi:hypothetical protein